MQVNYFGGDKFELNAKGAKIILSGNTIDVDQFIIEGPGEYERMGVFIEGISVAGDEVVYTIRAEEMIVCYLGRLTKKLSDETVKRIGDVDLLFVPLGEEGTISDKDAISVISQIDPQGVVPMLYSDISAFKNAEGIHNGELETLKIKKSDFGEGERNFYILKPKK
jgi:L-ascorbate metabolism protein UlaG (beta-lactamase superfamily)